MEPDDFKIQIKQKFSALDPGVKVRWDLALNYPATIRGKLSLPSNEEPEKIVKRFLQVNSELFKLKEPEKELKFNSLKTDSKRNSRFYFHQIAEDIPVWGGYIAVTINPEGIVTGFEAKYHTDFKVEMPKGITSTKKEERKERKLIPPRDAISVAKEHSGGVPQGKPFLVIYPFENAYHLAYHVEMLGSEGENPADWIYFIDAYTGKIMRRFNAINFAEMVNGSGIGINLNETAASPVHDFRVFHDDDNNYYLRNTEITPEIRICDIAGGGLHNNYAGRDDLSMDTDTQWNDSNNPSRVDNQRTEAEGYWSMHRVVDYFTRDIVVNGIHLFNRNGWDNAGNDWRVVVHYQKYAGTNYTSSFFSRNPTYGHRVYHGDGDGITRTYKAALDVNGHEWTHGVQFSEIPPPVPGAYGGFNSDLVDPISIGEASCDIIGCTIDAGWHIRREFEAEIFFTGALRSLENPPLYGGSDHMNAVADGAGHGWRMDISHYYENSTILSHAFYLMAMGGRHPTGVAGYEEISVIGQGVDFAENLVYRYLVFHAAANDTVQDFRDKVILSCNDLYPGDTCREWCVKRAFDAVGLYDDAIGGVTPIPAGINLHITPWGARNGQAPYWQSPDVYCLDESDIIVEPKKNKVNRLVAVVRNIGSTDANNASVNFYYSPFGFGYRHEDFKFIGSAVIDVPADGTDIAAEVDWDLTDLTDTFGGEWPHPVGDFDHFCIRVEIIHPGEVYTCDNECQHNFTNVGTEELPDGDGDGVWKFLIANPYPEPVWMMIHVQSNLPSSMKYGIKVFGDDKIKIEDMPTKPDYLPENVYPVPLAAKQKKVAELRVFIPRQTALRLAKAPGGRKNLTSISLSATIKNVGVGGIEVGFFGKDLWNIPRFKPVVPGILYPTIEGKVYSLSYNDRGEFIGFTLRLIDRKLKYFESMSESLEERLNEARSESRFVMIRLDQKGKIDHILINGR